MKHLCWCVFEYVCARQAKPPTQRFCLSETPGIVWLTNAPHIVFERLFAGLCKGAGLLPNGPLNVSVGGTIVFTTTLSPTEVSIETIDWRVNETTYITFSNETSNVTEPEYEGRVSLLPTTGSLELRNVTLSDTGLYQVYIVPRNGRILTGSTSLQVYGEHLAECNGYPVSAKSCLLNHVQNFLQSINR